MAIVFDNKFGDTAFEVLSGEYDIEHLEITGTILDIGSNAGSFAVWARQRWPEAAIICYEPAREMFEELHDTIAGDHLVRAINCAVTSQGNPRLYHGRTNTTEASLYVRSNTLETDFEDVSGLHPSLLPPCEFLKIDAEGSEFDILSHYEHEPRGIALEWHSHDERMKITKLLADRGYTVRQSPNVIINLALNVNIGIIKAWK